MKYLIIDDSYIEVYLLKIQLKQHNYGDPIYCFPNGLVALEYFKGIEKNNSLSSIPEFIFLDINMPLMNGFSFLDGLINLPEDLWRDIKVIMITSSDDIADRQKAAMYKSIKAFYTKPFDITIFNKEFREKIIQSLKQ